MNIHEIIITATLSALMTTAGIKCLSPEAKELTEKVTYFATVKDRYLVIGSEITGRNLFDGMGSAITPREIEELALDMKAAGTVRDIETLTPGITQEAAAAVTRWEAQ
jgi:hypothetical protein